MDIHTLLIASKKAQGDWYNAVFDSVCLTIWNWLTPDYIAEKFKHNLVELLSDPVAIGHTIMGVALFVGVVARTATAILKFWYTYKNKGANGD